MVRAMFTGYHDVTLIGEGGLGRVYRAVKDSTGGIVAIKELREVPASSPAWHRAKRELDAMLRLKGHPYVVSVEEIIDGPNGPSLVMEFLEGGTLMDRVLGSGALTVPEVVLVGLHVTQALAAAHQVGVVHRDIKPHNLLVGGFGQVKVADFGIASLAREGTRTATSALTLSYASPEQLDDDQPVGPASDVYSLAVTLLHLFTGRRPSLRDPSRRFDDAAALGAADAATGGLGVVLRACLNESPSERPTMEAAHQAFASASSMLGTAALTRLVVGPTRSPSAPVVAPTLVRPLVAPAPPLAGSATTVVGAAPILPPPAHTTATRPPVHAAATVVKPPVPPAGNLAETTPAAPTTPGSRGRGKAPRKVPVVVGTVFAVVAGAVIGAIAILGGGDGGNGQDGGSGEVVSSSPAVTAAPADDEAERATPTVAPTTTQGVTAPVPTTDAEDPSYLQFGWCQTSEGAHQGKALAAAFSPDGIRIVTVGDDSNVMVWDAADNRLLKTLPEHDQALYSVQFSPDGDWMVTAGADGVAKLWDGSTFDYIRDLRGHDGEILWAAFSPDSSEVITSGKDATIRRWDVESGQQIGELRGHDGWVYSAEFSPDGTLIVSAGRDGTARLWEVSSGASTVFHSSSRFVHVASFSANGRWILTGGGDAVARVFDASTLRELDSVVAHPSTLDDGSRNYLISAMFNPNATQILTTSQSGEISVSQWKGSTSGELIHDSNPMAPANFGQYRPDGGKYVLPRDDGTYILCGARS